MDENLTLDKIKESIDKLEAYASDPHKGYFNYNPFSNMLSGIPVIEVEPDIRPVIEFRGFKHCSEEFKAKQQQWLIDMFGTKDYTTVEKGVVFNTSYGMIIRKDDFSVLRAALA